jgi:hypothetical protein
MVTIQGLPGTVPHGLTFAEAFIAIEAVLKHGVGMIQIGDVTLNVTAI